VQFNWIEALKSFDNAPTPDDTEVDVCTRQLFTFLTQILKLDSVAPLQNRNTYTWSKYFLIGKE